MKCTNYHLVGCKYTINFITTIKENGKFKIVVFFTSTDCKHSFYVSLIDLFLSVTNDKPCGPYNPKLTLRQNLEIMKNEVLIFGTRKAVRIDGLLFNYLNWSYDKEANKT